MITVTLTTILGWAFLFASLFGWTITLAFVFQRVRIMHKEYLAGKKQREHEGKMNVASDTPPALLAPKERREYMLNHIEDGRFYAISSLRNSETVIVCAKRYDAEEQRLYCYAYLWISGKENYNLHIEAPIDTAKFCDFLGKKRLRIDLDRNPHVVVFEEENISPYIVDRDYNTFVHSVQAAGFDWKIERGEMNMPGSYKYILKETRTK